MSAQTLKAAEELKPKAVQRCILPHCGGVYAISERIYVCPRCGGPLEIDVHLPPANEAPGLRKLWAVRAGSRDARDRSGVWRFRELLPFEDSAPVVTLFEGNTPLYDAPRCAEYAGLIGLRLKHQGCNPTGSFKDTGMTAALTQAVVLGAETVICASTGNTAASLSAYAARAGLQAAILVPYGQISAAKLAQSMDYGATIFELDGNFDDCMRLIQDLGDEPSIYVANSINPFRVEGQKTVAFELMQQCDWGGPDHVVVPGGNMGNSTALGKGFEELLRLGLIDRLPKLSVIQAEGSAPLARLFATLGPKQRPPAQSSPQPSSPEPLSSESWLDDSRLPGTMAPVEHPRTLATAIKIGAPISWRKALRVVLRSHGRIISVSEQEIADAKSMIGRDGIGCEPASATTVAGIRRLVASGYIGPTDTVIAVLTGHVLKDPDYVSNYHRGTLALDTGEGNPRPIHGSFRNAPQRVEATKQSILGVLGRRK
ncbi:MAG TPA: threonine synthase [Candidatus Acidoferrales bacterium]|nr:threonine synthase [Candidatus Acidoferrales bacterium]